MQQVSAAVKICLLLRTLLFQFLHVWSLTGRSSGGAGLLFKEIEMRKLRGGSNRSMFARPVAIRNITHKPLIPLHIQNLFQEHLGKGMASSLQSSETAPQHTHT